MITTIFFLVLGWVFLILYYILLSRDFMADLVRVELVPYIVGRQFYLGVRRLLPSPQVVEKKISNWQEFLQNEKAQRKLATGRKALLGRNIERPIFADLVEDRHLLITGNTGEGKSTIAMNMVLGLLSQGPKILDKIELCVLDSNTVAAQVLQPLAHSFAGIEACYQPETILAALERLVDEMHKRMELMGEKGIFSSFDKLGLPHKLIIFDEPAVLFDEAKEYSVLVRRLVSSGRKVGFHVVVITPSAHSKIIETTYRGNLMIVSGHMRKHTEKIVEYMPVSQLRRYEFAYLQDERRRAISFSPFPIKEADFKAVIDNMLGHQTGSREVALHIFMNEQNCGYRTLLRSGLHYYQALLKNGEVKQIPFPWNACSDQSDHFSFTAEAKAWARRFLQELEDKKIAGQPRKGAARERLVSEPEAIRIIFDDSGGSK